jgi:hypothetical protein
MHPHMGTKGPAVTAELHKLGGECGMDDQAIHAEAWRFYKSHGDNWEVPLREMMERRKVLTDEQSAAMEAARKGVPKNG